jgi:hypothetical protein
MDGQGEKQTRQAKKTKKHSVPDQKPVEKEEVCEFRRVSRGQSMTMDELAGEVWK